MTSKYDVAILGAGPGGYVAAIRAAQMGANVAVIERDELGGVCLNRGCIPTKAWIHSSSFYARLADAEKLGVTVGERSYDFSAMRKHTGDVVSRLVQGVGFLLKKRNVEVIRAEGTLTAPDTIALVGDDAPDRPKTDEPSRELDPDGNDTQRPKPDCDREKDTAPEDL